MEVSLRRSFSSLRDFYQLFTDSLRVVDCPKLGMVMHPDADGRKKGCEEFFPLFTFSVSGSLADP